MKNLLSVFVFSFLFISTQLFGSVVAAPNLDLIEKCISELDENALVVFDVDYTLIVPDDRILAPCGEAYFQKFIENHQDIQDEGLLHSKVMLRSKVSLVDEKILSLLENLKQKNIKVIALTAMPTGRLGIIPSAEQWRVEQLASLGIYLDWSFPEMNSFTLNEFAGEKNLPVFKQGILSSSFYPKGQVLCAFLKNMSWQPSKVLFIDDKMSFIKSVECELDKTNINHVSFHYTEARDRPCCLDEKLAEFQLNYLMHNREWLTEEEAMKKMEALE